MTIAFLFLLLAFGLFLAAAFGVDARRVSLVPLGLASFVLSLLVGGSIAL